MHHEEQAQDSIGQNAFHKAASYAAIPLLVTACTCGFSALYFCQFPTLGSTSNTAITVSISTLVVLAALAMLSQRIYFAPTTLSAAVIFLLLVRHLFLSNLLGTQTLVTNILVGMIMSLSIAAVGAGLGALPAKQASLILAIGFALACLVQLFFVPANLKPLGMAQEILLALASLSVFAIGMLKPQGSTHPAENSKTPILRNKSIYTPPPTTLLRHLALCAAPQLFRLQ